MKTVQFYQIENSVTKLDKMQIIKKILEKNLKSDIIYT